MPPCLSPARVRLSSCDEPRDTGAVSRYPKAKSIRIRFYILPLSWGLFLIATHPGFGNTLWLGGFGDYETGSNWSGGSTPPANSDIEIASGTASFNGSTLTRSAHTRLHGGSLRLPNASFVQGATAPASLEISEGLFEISADTFVLSDYFSSTAEQTGGEVRADIKTSFHFSRRTGRQAEVRIADGEWKVDYTGNSLDPLEDSQVMGRGGNDSLILNGGLLRFSRSTGVTRRIDIQRNSIIEINDGVLETDNFPRFSVGRDRPGEASVIVNGGEFRMLNTRADAGGIVLGDYTDGRIVLNDGILQITPSSNPSSRRKGMILGRKGKSDTGRSVGTFIQNGGLLDLPGLFLDLGDIGSVFTYSYGGRGSYFMNGGVLRARDIRTWDGVEFVADEPGDSYFFFHAGEIILEGNQTNWPERSFVNSRSHIERLYNPLTNTTSLVADPNFDNPATFRYFRFTPTRRRGGGVDNVIVQLAEFVFLREGLALDTSGLTVTNPGGSNPNGEEPLRIIDGDPQTKWLDFNQQPLIFAFPDPVMIDSYRLTTANDFPDRDPLRWTLEGSDDGTNWVMIDRQARNFPLPRRRFTETPPLSLPAEVLGEFDPAAFDVRYVRFIPLEAANPESAVTQVSRLEFYRDEVRIFPISVSGIPLTGDAGNVNDGRVRSHWEGATSTAALTFDFGESVSLDSFLIANGPSEEGAGPVRWRIEGSFDATSWFTLDDRSIFRYNGLDKPFAVSGVEPFQRVFDLPRLIWTANENMLWDTDSRNWDFAGFIAWDNQLDLQAEFPVGVPRSVRVAESIEVESILVSGPGFTIQGDGSLNFGGTGTVALEFETIFSTDFFSEVGLSKAGHASLVYRGDAEITGSLNIEEGEIHFAGGSSWRGDGTLNIGSIDSARGSVTFDADSTFDFRGTGMDVRLGLGSFAVGAVTQDRGTVLFDGETRGFLSLGNAPHSYGSWVLEEGSLLSTGSSGRAGIRIGDGGQGVFIQKGGLLDYSGPFSISRNGGLEGEGVASFLGGSAALGGVGPISLAERADSIATFNLGTLAGGNAVVETRHPDGIDVGKTNSPATAILNLNSGVLTVYGPIHRSGADAEGFVNASGGRIRAGAPALTLLDASLSRVNLFPHSLTIDTQAFDATITASLKSPTGLGFYPTAGIIIPVNGGSGYIGPPLVRVSSDGFSSNTAAIAIVEDGVVSGIHLTSPGENHAQGDTLTFSFSGGGSISPASTLSIGLKEEDLAPNASGGLIKEGSGTLSLAGPALYSGLTEVREGGLEIQAAFPTSSLFLHSETFARGSFSTSGDIDLAGDLIPGTAPLEANCLTTRSGGSLTIEFNQWEGPPGVAHTTVKLETLQNRSSVGSPFQLILDGSHLQGYEPEDRDFLILEAHDLDGFHPGDWEVQPRDLPTSGYWHLLRRDNRLYVAHRMVEPSVFNLWIHSFPNLGAYGVNGNPDLDPLSNLLEYIGDRHPGRPDASDFLRVHPPINNVFRFEMDRHSDSSGVARQWVEYSADLVEWTSLELPVHSTGDVVIQEDIPRPGMQRLTISISPVEGYSKHLFCRFRAEPLPEPIPNP